MLISVSRSLVISGEGRIDIGPQAAWKYFQSAFVLYDRLEIQVVSREPHDDGRAAILGTCSTEPGTSMYVRLVNIDQCKTALQAVDQRLFSS
ncbi:hypothetical protein M404DRAFT_921829 [Pisolithus tinctorius Marx 270]|uniref:Uncharacterized protein n=1 Tax=Pisolithus tinctorius Marx 270 TaxID=870435 RepID=A0A0C3IJB7_PISTI|nr:hypothetical protein M404DRAFT_921829 [Pisolithus tinctorius Marx 270]